MIFLLVLLAVCLLAYTNGANDNFKIVPLRLIASPLSTSWNTVRPVLASWVITLPVAALLAALTYLLVQSFSK